MSVDSFGYQVMSLDELIAELVERRDERPELGAKPVWIGNLPPLHWPVKYAGLNRDRSAVELTVERGGN